MPLDPITGTIITGVGNVLGGMWQNSAQTAAAREQMAFQERMSNTAYQRATKDMRAAGLNPMLAYGQGGASTPGGAMPSLENVLSPAINSAMAARRLAADIKVANQQAANLFTDTMKKAEETKLVHTQIAESKRRALATEQGTENARINNTLLRLSLPGARITSQIEGNEILRGLRTGLGLLNPLSYLGAGLLKGAH